MILYTCGFCAALAVTSMQLVVVINIDSLCPLGNFFFIPTPWFRTRLGSFSFTADPKTHFRSVAANPCWIIYSFHQSHKTLETTREFSGESHAFVRKFSLGSSISVSTTTSETVILFQALSQIGAAQFWGNWAFPNKTLFSYKE